MSKSVKRVGAAAEALGLSVDILRMEQSTRTAEEAAQACGSEVDQIVKSMVFEGADSGDLILVLVSGRHNLKLEAAARIFGEDLKRASADRIRAETGFAIGGVAPIGHLCEITCWMDDVLMGYDKVWAAAGAPNAMFAVAPADLLAATKARLFIN